MKRLQAGLERVYRLFTYDVPAQPPGGPPVRSMTIVDYGLRPQQPQSIRARLAEVVGAGNGISAGDESPGGERDSEGGRRGGGPADIVDDDGGEGGRGGDGGGVGVGRGTAWGADGAPADAFEMIMASLRYKLDLRERAYQNLAAK